MTRDVIAAHADFRPRKAALVDLASGRHWTYAELDITIARTANWLIDALGTASGERVATLARNCADMIVLQFACVRAGAIFVPLNWRLAPAEIAVLLDDATPAILLRDPDFPVAGFSGIVQDLVGLSALVAAHDTTACSAARRPFDAASTLLYTSGTSGRPKGVIISEANAFWGSTNFNIGNGVGPDSIFLCDMPLFHTAGLFANARSPLQAGGTLLVSPGFDPARTLTLLGDRDKGITHYFSVPQIAQTLWNFPGFDPAMLTGLEVYAMGGAPNPAAQIERFVRAGINMSDGFGMSETCSNFGMPVADRDQLIAKAGSCGKPYIGVEARIVDEAGGDVPVGTVGELLIRGPSVTQGYWNQPELSAKAFSDGWFRTGDAARMDAEGFYYLVDRKKDMFISGGENVYPAEIEAVIAEMTDIAECAVIGIADDRWGEVGCAFVVAVPGRPVSADTVIAHCKTRLAGFKVPSRVVVGAEIPRTGSGKVQKHLLKRPVYTPGSTACGTGHKAIEHSDLPCYRTARPGGEMI